MTIDDKMKTYNPTLTEEQQKYQHYQSKKLINTNILHMEKSCHLIKVE